MATKKRAAAKKPPPEPKPEAQDISLPRLEPAPEVPVPLTKPAPVQRGLRVPRVPGS